MNDIEDVYETKPDVVTDRKSQDIYKKSLRSSYNTSSLKTRSPRRGMSPSRVSQSPTRDQAQTAMGTRNTLKPETQMS
jgi:hypothetical protein